MGSSEFGQQSSPRLIRRAAGADAPALAVLYKELTGDPDVSVLAARIEEMAGSETSFLLVVEIGEAVCGTAPLTLCPDAMYGRQPFGVIENLVVAGSHRRLGLGRALLSDMERIALERDASKLMLLSGSHRTDAHALFRKCGFAADAKRAFVKYRRHFQSSLS